MTQQINYASVACSKSCACHAHLINRRDFITLTAATTLVGMIGSPPVIAGPLEASDFARLIPPDKKLSREWVKSLFARGEPTTYSMKRDELRFIGMPVGGICCGTVYLGGDSKLWVWDIFNEYHEGILPGDTGASGGANYVKPHVERSPLDQGFALKVGESIRRFESDGWENIEFQGQYPIGRVRYSDPASPVSAVMTAYSPFIPLNANDSGLPVTVCEFKLENLTAAPIDVEIGGWMQNASRLSSGTRIPGSRVNTHRKTSGAMILDAHFAEDAAAQASIRPDVVIEDFQHEGYGLWKTEGTAFGSGPILRKNAPVYQGDLGGGGDYIVNSHATAPGSTVGEKDAAALRACEAMAQDMGDTAYAFQCGLKLAQTRRALETTLYNGEYFVQLPEAGHENSLGVYQTSHID